MSNAIKPYTYHIMITNSYLILFMNLLNELKSINYLNLYLFFGTQKITNKVPK